MRFSVQKCEIIVRKPPCVRALKVRKHGVKGTKEASSGQNLKKNQTGFNHGVKIELLTQREENLNIRFLTG